MTANTFKKTSLEGVQAAEDKDYLYLKINKATFTSLGVSASGKNQTVFNSMGYKGLLGPWGVMLRVFSKI